MKVHNCIDCPLMILRGKTKKGEVYFARNCTTEMCDTMTGEATEEDVRFYIDFHKEPMTKAGGLPVKLYRDWLEHVNKFFEMAEAPKLW